MLSKFNNKKHRRLTALLLCVALMLGSVTSVSADISAADSETEVQSGVQTYAEEPTTEAVSYEAPETQAEVQEGTPVAEEKHLQQILSRQRHIPKLQQKHIQRQHRKLRQNLRQRHRFQKRQNSDRISQMVSVLSLIFRMAHLKRQLQISRCRSTD